MKRIFTENVVERTVKNAKFVENVDLDASSSSSQTQTDKYRIKNGIYLTKIEGLDKNSSFQTFSLLELISRINPIASIHFNFCIDPDFLISQYPQRCCTTPITLITGQNSKSELATRAFKHKNIVVDGAALPFPYGTHHAKLSLFESEDALHVVVSTANLIPEDYGLKTQAFYYCRAPFGYTLANDVSIDGQKITENKNNFGHDLLEYLECGYGSGKLAHKSVGYWISRLRDGQPDFSSIPDRLIGSLPGRHTGTKLPSFGHMKLRNVLSAKFNVDELGAQTTRIAQFSSIGTLGVSAHSWLCDEFLKSLAGGIRTNPNPSFLKLIYPTVDNVRESLEGYVAGLSLPYTSKVDAKQPWLRTMLHHWKSDTLKRSKAMPHIKSYTALNEETQKPDWLLITSANLSQSAWGRLEKQQSQLFCRSYELGVLVCQKDHQNVMENGQGNLFLPYDLPLQKYSQRDRPFLVDYPYDEPDCMGRKRTDLGTDD